MRSGSNGPRVGSYNRMVVLDAIRETDGVSRVELARRTGLTPQTVSNIVRRLITDGLVVESGSVQGQMGKPRTVLRLNVAVNYAVGVHIDPVAVTCVVVDLSGRVVGRARRSQRHHSRPATVVTHVVGCVETAISRSGVDPAGVVGVGIAAPGAIDADAGEVIGPPNLPGWGRVALRDSVSSRLGMPVLLDNDATAAALGERWVGGPERSGSFAFVYLGTGIGCGLVLAGQVYRGATGNAGELGHLSIDVEGRECHCGNLGCLEAYISPAAICAEVTEAGGAPPHADWGSIARAVRKADPHVVEAVDRAAVRLAQALVGLVNLFDVPRVVIGGRDVGPLTEQLVSVAHDRLARNTMARQVQSVEVVPSIVGESAGAIGAASMVLHSSYAPRLSVLLANST